MRYFFYGFFTATAFWFSVYLIACWVAMRGGAAIKNVQR